METLTLPGVEYRPVSRVKAKVTNPIKSSTDVWVKMRNYTGEDREHFVVLDLDTRHRVIAKRVVHIGCLNGVEVHPREVFRPAIANGAASMILVHNHPSSDPTPSREDIMITKRLREVGELVGIAVLDHVVIGRDGYVSMADKGWGVN